jgi:hypothetical protein
MAYLEAASVPAFRRLADEVVAHHGPDHLREAAVRAARDEVRHARVVTRLAKRAGAPVRKPVVRRSRSRSLVAMAIENAVEGCVNETFGAAVGMVQAMTASDPRVRSAMRPIARDEMRHAELAWEVARWVDRRLTDRERARVKKARAAAVLRLVEQVSREVDRELVEGLGLPTAPVARALAVKLAGQLWV